MGANITLDPTDLVEVEGREAVFTCSAFGNPPPEIVWYLGDSRLENGSVYFIEEDAEGAEIFSTLTFTATEQLSGSTFTCRAENTQGNDTSAPATLEVQSKSVVVVLSQPT